ncbi:copper resistance protein CopZ [Sporosarcina sp. BI001-red]|uniref:copper chaperone CopZ n=1 Tax=Sporosarcina sp. BI001-red TaxID=2282866 RepID=UPI000E226801|nr:copper chaperone CopZ [Sporosarcina sp. BI001-red]REB07777.1 copper resistance protein CopZ [Sporosarcina sp. BI001-red]
MEQTTLTVKGMSCGHCVKAVEDSVGKLTGVESVSVNLDAGTVQVSHDATTADRKVIEETIEDQGYDVVQ